MPQSEPLTEAELAAIEARNELSTGKREHSSGDYYEPWCDPEICPVCVADSAAITDRQVLLAEIRSLRERLKQLEGR